MAEQKLTNVIRKKINKNVKCPQSVLLLEEKISLKEKTDQIQEKAAKLNKNKLLSATESYFYPALFGFVAC
ncbi:MAG TPA: hypothetical protein VHE99_00100 [Gammaproteobacteria bacterium]|nr:hypothetical protein [Gammaproteobacteria bacterium]